MLSSDDLGIVFAVIGCVLVAGTLVRVLYSTIGRWLGFYNPAHFHLFLWIPWRPVWRQVVKIRSWREETSTMGKEATSRWAPLLDRLCLVYKPGLILLGRHRAAGIAIQQPAGLEDPRGVAIIASPGTGKSTQAISWIALDPGNAFIIDPKGQLASITARRKGAGGPGVIGQGKKVRILDPMRQVPDFTSAMWNLFDLLATVEKGSAKTWWSALQIMQPKPLCLEQVGKRTRSIQASASSFSRALSWTSTLMNHP
jgi:hypothetical protein